MKIRPWRELPACMRTREVYAYYKILRTKKVSLAIKRGFDGIVSLLLLLFFMPVMVGIGLWIFCDSPGSIFFRQNRVTQYGKIFRIWKFRTMEIRKKPGSPLTVQNDARITRAGKILRKYRLDEMPQLFNILAGDMSFVGTRPEVPEFVAYYTREMYATLLLPAGLTSRASICYQDEERLLANVEDVKSVYIKKILPEKMRFNLAALKHFSLISELSLLVQTVISVAVRTEEKRNSAGEMHFTGETVGR